MKIFHISDTHGYHNQIQLPEYDIIVCSGDCSNYYDSPRNSVEVWKFIEWYKTLPGIKIYVPGNHDTSIERKHITSKDFADNGICMLIDEQIIFDGIKFYGSPWTPQFGQWAYMKARHKMDIIWQQIPSDTDVLITHGPPKGILDLTENRDHQLEQCGDKSLLNFVNKLHIKYHLFGHVHNYKSCINSGILRINNQTFSNAACVTDREFDKGITFNGNLITI